MAMLRKNITITASLILLIIGACAGSQNATKVSMVGNEKDMVEITADSFDFEPSIIEVKSGEPILLKIKTISSGSHNLTVTDPAGQVIEDVDLPPNKTITVEINFKKPGTYEFYCDKPLHTTFGMKGRFEVIAAP